MTDDAPLEGAYDETRPLTVGDLKRALRGISEDAWVVVQDDDGHWTPTSVAHLPTGGGAPGQVVLSDEPSSADLPDVVRFVPGLMANADPVGPHLAFVLVALGVVSALGYALGRWLS